MRNSIRLHELTDEIRALKEELASRTSESVHTILVEPEGYTQTGEAVSGNLVPPVVTPSHRISNGPQVSEAEASAQGRYPSRRRLRVRTTVRSDIPDDFPSANDKAAESITDARINVSRTSTGPWTSVFRDFGGACGNVDWARLTPPLARKVRM